MKKRTAAKLNGTKAAVNTVETKAAVKAEEVKAPAKVEETKVEVAPAKVEETKVEAAPAKVAEEKKEAPKKAAAKKTATKTTAKKAVKEELKPEVMIQYQGHEAVVAEVIEKAKAEFVADGHRASSIKTLQIYLKPEEYAAYYVINQKVAGRVDLF